MSDAAIIHVSHAVATAAPSEGSGSSLLVLVVAALSVFLTTVIVRTSFKVFSAMIDAAVRVGAVVLAVGFAAIVGGIVYIANIVFNFVPS